MASKLARASREKSGHANVRSDFSRQIVHVWLANDGNVKDQEGVFVLVSIAGVVLTAITAGYFDLRYDDLRRALRFGEDVILVPQRLLTTDFNCDDRRISTVRHDCRMMLVLRNFFELLKGTAA